MAETNPPSIAFGVVLLAAGRSRRMGRPKLLLPWKEASVLAHLLELWRRLGAAQIGLVRATHDAAMEAALAKLGFSASNQILNPDPDRGMFSSIQAAANWNGWNANLTHLLITLGDQPHLRESTLRQLLGVAAAHPDSICQPLRNSRRRHPVILPSRIFAELRETATGELKSFLMERAIWFTGFESDDPGLDWDMDSPEDYERLLRFAANDSDNKPSSTASASRRRGTVH